MFNCTRVRSMEYYEAANRQALSDLPKALRSIIEEGLRLHGEDKTDDETAMWVAARYKALNSGKFKTEAAAFEYAYDKAMKVFIPDESRPSEVGRNGEGRSGATYYTDNGASESAGTYYHRKRGQDRGEALAVLISFPTPPLPLDRPINQHAVVLNPEVYTGNPFASVVHGATAPGASFRALAAGRDPVTSEIIRNAKNHNKPIRPVGKDGVSKVSVGYDCQFACPKSVTMLAMAGDPELRQGIFDDHDAALQFALDFVIDEGLLVTRTGAQGRDKEACEEVAAVKYRHFTSRAGDPQLHTHVVILNMARRADGSIGAIDNASMLKYQHAIGGAYRAELARRMQARGFDVVRKKRHFEIAGISDAVIETFSKRRAQIAKAAEGTVDPLTGEIVGSFDPSKDRAQAQHAANSTRDAKKDVPDIIDLEDRWNTELAGLNLTRETLVESARVEARIMARARTAAEAAGEKPLTVAERAMKSVEALMGNDSVFHRRQLYAAVLEEMQGVCGAAEALEAIANLEATGQIIAVGTVGEEPVYSTGEMVELEKSMFRMALGRQDEREFVSAEAIEQVLLRAKYSTVRAEQAAAVRHALNRDGVTIIEGLAGSGKSFSTEIIKDVCEDCGLSVFGIAPSHKARDVLRNDAKLAEEMTAAVAGVLNKLQKGEIVWDKNTVVVLDEAGMVGTKDMEALMQWTARAGCKFILSGDSRQLQPVTAGAPFKSLSDELGAARMDDIQRQKGSPVGTNAKGEVIYDEEEGAAMRAASVELAIGKNPHLALEYYDRTGCVVLHDEREETIAALVADYVASVAIPDAVISAQTRPITRAVLTNWNMDVRDINIGIRAALQRDRFLGRDLVTFKASPRGGDTPEDLSLAIGDQIIFGEAIKDYKIYNSDMAKIDKIDASNPADPLLTFTMNKGGTITARASQLIGYRDPEAKGPHAPKLQHSYCMSIHASQGCTFDFAWVANIRGMGREALYVAMSRHRFGVRLYGSLDRIYDRIAAKTTGAAGAVGKGGAVLAEEGDRHSDPTHQEAKAELFAEVMNSELKMNAADFIKGGIRKWLGIPTAVEKKAAADPVAVELASSVRANILKGLPPTPEKTAVQLLVERTHAIQAADPALVVGLTRPPSRSLPKASGATPAAGVVQAKAPALETVATPRKTGFGGMKAVAVEKIATPATVAAVPQAVPAKKGFGSMAKASTDSEGGEQGQSAPVLAYVPPAKTEQVEQVKTGFGGMSKGIEDEAEETAEVAPVVATKPADTRFGMSKWDMLQTKPTEAKAAVPPVVPPVVPAAPPAAPVVFAAAAPARPSAAKTTDSDRQDIPMGRVSPEERDEMVRADLIDFATDQLSYKTLSINKDKTQAVLEDGDDRITVTQTNENIWIWTPTKGGGNAKAAMIWDLVQRANGGTRVKALHSLREMLATWKPDPLRKANVAKTAKTMGGTDEDRRRMHDRFRLSTGGASKYLVRARGLDASMLNRFNADVRQEGTHPTNTNKDGAMFAHRNIDGEITGFVRRGYPVLHEDGLMKSFRLHQKGGEPNMMLAGEKRKPARIYVSESAIDTFSRYQMDNQPAKALLTSTDGQPSDRALAMYAELARRHPETEWHIGFDNDDERIKPNGERWRPGEDFGNKVREAILSGNPDAKIVDRRCAEDFKDANDELRGITKTMAKEQAATLQAANDAEKARAEQERERQEEERRRREEEARRAAEPPAYRPRGPR